jgi:hypothetical protein
METAQPSEAPQDVVEVDLPSRRLSGSEEFRASLEAVRSAQAAARARARRETRWARVIAVGFLMAAGATAWAAAHRPTKERTKARAITTTPSVAAATVPPSIATPEATPSLAPRPPEAPPVAPPAPPVAIAPTERFGAAIKGDDGDRVALCDAAFANRSWPSVASTCVAAFEARPRDSALAMRVAQAEHRRGHSAIAADWARKALALEADLPEAFVLIARAEKESGHATTAADAYRRYLTLAPRGWHAAEAHRALAAAR